MSQAPRRNLGWVGFLIGFLLIYFMALKKVNHQGQDQIVFDQIAQLTDYYMTRT